MTHRVEVLRPLGSCRVGEFIGLELDGVPVEGRIMFLARTPGQGWLLTIEGESGIHEVCCSEGRCTLVSQLTEPAEWTFESDRTAVDSRTGRRWAMA
jgi:hypothetical protein